MSATTIIYLLVLGMFVYRKEFKAKIQNEKNIKY